MHISLGRVEKGMFVDAEPDLVIYEYKKWPELSKKIRDSISFYISGLFLHSDSIRHVIVHLKTLEEGYKICFEALIRVENMGTKVIGEDACHEDISVAVSLAADNVLDMINKTGIPIVINEFA